MSKARNKLLRYPHYLTYSTVFGNQPPQRFSLITNHARRSSPVEPFPKEGQWDSAQRPIS